MSIKRTDMGKKHATTEVKVTSYEEDTVSAVGSFFNGLQVPKVDFDIYKHKNKFVLHGEAETLEYNGSTNDDEQNDYILGVYDPINKSVDLFKTPFMNAQVTARNKRKFTGPRVKQIGKRNYEQRNALGEAFGTKKAKAAITNLEKNRIVADRLQDVEMDIVDTVADATQDLPSRDKMAAEVISDRPTPYANVDATNVEDVYSIESIIPNKEFALLRVQHIISAEEDARLDLLPYNSSTYINKNLNQYCDQGHLEKVQLLYYASLLLGVYNNRRVRDKQTLMENLGNPAEGLIDGILERFTAGRAGQFGKSKERSYVIDPHNEDRLLCYLLAVVLHVNNFLVELPPLAMELNMKPTRLVGLFRALGAVIKASNLAQAEAFGIPRSSASTYKVATLKVPFKLPEMVRRGSGKKR